VLRTRGASSATATAYGRGESLAAWRLPELATCVMTNRSKGYGDYAEHGKGLLQMEV
jgi:hypothetical protein